MPDEQNDRHGNDELEHETGVLGAEEAVVEGEDEDDRGQRDHLGDSGIEGHTPDVPHPWGIDRREEIAGVGRFGAGHGAMIAGTAAVVRSSALLASGDGADP